MASIAEWIEKIKTAIYGEEVRGAIWQSLEAMNTEVEAINVDEDQIEQNKQDIATNTAAITELNSRTNVTVIYTDAQVSALGGINAAIADAVAQKRFPEGVPFSGMAQVNSRYHIDGYIYPGYQYGSILMQRFDNDILFASIKAGVVSVSKLPTRSEVDANTAAITALNSSSQSVLTIASGWNSDGNWCIKKAGVVEMYIQITGGTYSSGWNQVATLPEGYRPKYSFDSIQLDNGSTNLADVKIQADGKVLVYKTETLSNNLRFHTVFITA